jgi:hypothetical protein
MVEAAGLLAIADDEKTKKKQTNKQTKKTNNNIISFLHNGTRFTDQFFHILLYISVQRQQSRIIQPTTLLSYSKVT